MKKQSLLPEQDQAANPVVNVSVQANAGTGKTFVLVHRLLRTLFREQDDDRGTILCLTYTNAGAAEMRNRILGALRDWATADDEALRDLLFGISPRPDASIDDLSRARSIFYQFIDNPNLLKIQTIHGFCEEVLRKYPMESGVPSVWRLVSGAEQKRLLKKSFSELIKNANKKTEEAFSIVMDQISESSLDDLLDVLTGQYRRFFALKQHANYREQFVDTTYKFLKISDTAKKAFFSPSAVNARKNLEEIIQSDLDQKQNSFLLTYFKILKDFNSGKIDFSEYKIDGRIKRDYLNNEKELTNDLQQENANADIYKNSIAFFDLCDSFADKYLELKRFQGLLDFDDLLLYTNKLFSDPSKMGWVLSSLDSNVRHILVDEAQDTSPEQWDILTSLTSDFGVTGDTKNPHSIFIVGDTKQSIYSFQGASPDSFAESLTKIKNQVENNKRTFSELNLAQSFRSAAPILKVIDYFFDDISIRNKTNFINNVHKIFRINAAGLVEFHPLVSPNLDAGIKTDEARKKYVKTIANKIKTLVFDDKVNPSDIMVLVQRRNPFAAPLVNELKLAGVPVAGSDRIVLPEFPAIKDFLNLIRFSIDNSDNFALACVLKSPLFRFAEPDLYRVCFNRGKKNVIDVLQDANPDIYEELLQISDWAKLMQPYSFFMKLLNTNDRRSKIIAAFGEPVIDPLEEFLTICLSYERTQPGGLNHFIEWFMQGESEIRRDTENANGVRVMTIHSAKGLESKIVFLIDTIKNPKSGNPIKIKSPLKLKNGGLLWRGGAPETDILKTATDEDLQLKLQEYYRLLYVAMTRARDRLYIYGFKGERESGVEFAWHTTLSSVLPNMPGIEIDNENVMRFVQDGIKESESSIISKNKEFTPRPLVSLQKSGPELIQTEKNLTIADLIKQHELENYALNTGVQKHKELQFIDLNSSSELVDKIKSNKEISRFFEPNARTEMPIAGIINGKFQSRRIDRVVINKDEILFMDYKTDIDKLLHREHYESQMQDYAKLLSLVYTDRRISGFILWLNDFSLEQII